MTGASATIPSAVTPNDLEHRRAAVDALGQAGDVGGLCRFLRAREIPVSVAQEIRASELVMRLSRRGQGITSAEAAAEWLVPILARSRADAQLVRSAIIDWWRSRTPASIAAGPSVVEGLVWREKRRRWLAIGLVLTTLTAAVIALGYLASTVSIGARDFTGGVSEGLTEIGSHLIFTELLPALIVLAPFGLAIWVLLRARRVRLAVIRRETAAGYRFNDLPIPERPHDVFAGPTAAAAALALKAPSLRSGRRLDVRSSVVATLRSAGFPQIRRAMGRKTCEYVVLSERGGAADHVSLFAGALVRRLEAVDATVTRFDAHGHFRHVRHVAGRLSGNRVETLASIGRRYAGARLIVVGSGETFFDRASGNFARAPGFTPQHEGERLFGDFDHPVLLTTTPEERWGTREQRIADAGVTVFPATATGLAHAAVYFALADADADPPPAQTFAPGEDAFLASLRAGRPWMTSNIPPAEDNAIRLVWRLRGFVGGSDGFRVLCAIAAFPRIEPAITLFLAEKVLGRPLDEDLARRLARLPWLQDGRMPDWLRRALLRALPASQSEELRRVLFNALQELLEHGAARERGAAISAPVASTRIDLMASPSQTARVLRSVGLGADLVHGENIFLRFLEGEPLDELDQPAPDMPVRPGLWRLGAAALLVLAGAAAAYWGRGVIVDFLIANYRQLFVMLLFAMVALLLRLLSKDRLAWHASIIASGIAFAWGIALVTFAPQLGVEPPERMPALNGLLLAVSALSIYGPAMLAALWWRRRQAETAATHIFALRRYGLVLLAGTLASFVALVVYNLIYAIIEVGIPPSGLGITRSQEFWLLALRYAVTLEAPVAVLGGIQGIFVARYLTLRNEYLKGWQGPALVVANGLALFVWSIVSVELRIPQFGRDPTWGDYVIAAPVAGLIGLSIGSLVVVTLLRRPTFGQIAEASSSGRFNAHRPSGQSLARLLSKYRLAWLASIIASGIAFAWGIALVTFAPQLGIEPPQRTAALNGLLLALSALGIYGPAMLAALWWHRRQAGPAAPHIFALERDSAVFIAGTLASFVVLMVYNLMQGIIEVGPTRFQEVWLLALRYAVTLEAPVAVLGGIQGVLVARYLTLRNEYLKGWQGPALVVANGLALFVWSIVSVELRIPQFGRDPTWGDYVIAAPVAGLIGLSIGSLMVVRLVRLPGFGQTEEAR